GWAPAVRVQLGLARPGPVPQRRLVLLRRADRRAARPNLMKRILLVAATTGYQTRMFADAARRLGIELVLATDRCHVLEDPWGDHALPVRFEDPESAAEAIAQAGPFDGILAVADRPAYLAAVVAERLGLPYSSPASVAAARNKFLARQRFHSAGLPVPEFSRV